MSLPKQFQRFGWNLGAGVCVCVFTVGVYPISRANGYVSCPRTGAEVELLDGETLVVKTDAVRSAGRPVLDVSEVYVSIDHHVTATETANKTESLERSCRFSVDVTWSSRCSFLVNLGCLEQSILFWCRGSLTINKRFPPRWSFVILKQFRAQ